MKYLSKIAAACVLAVISKVAVAMPMDYTFDVNIISGDFQGTTTTVFVSLVGFTGSGVETFTQIDGNLLAFDLISPRGSSYGIDDALDGPSITLTNGALVDVVYWATARPAADEEVRFGINEEQMTFDASGGDGFVEYNDRGIINAQSFVPFQPSPEAIPSPATLVLFGLGLAGLGWSRRKKA